VSNCVANKPPYNTSRLFYSLCSSDYAHLRWIGIDLDDVGMWGLEGRAMVESLSFGERQDGLYELVSKRLFLCFEI
jgi:hypothetical protein